MIAPCPLDLIVRRDEYGGRRRHENDRLLTRIRPGVYVRTAEWEVLPPWDRYLARVHAVARAWKGPVFCLESASTLLGMPTFGETREIHLLSPDGTTWREGDVIVHGARDGREVVGIDGFSLTTLEETAVDLCRFLPPAFGLAVADAALRTLVAAGANLDLREHGRTQLNRRGLRRLEWIQERATAAAESVGESVSRAVIEWLGFETPELQVTFTFEGVEDRTDFFWRRQGIVGESDGYGKYDESDLEGSKAHFISEKIREDRLRRYLSGFGRWDWSDAMQWRKLDAKLRAAGLRPAHPSQPSMLASLSANPRAFPPMSRTKAIRPS